MRKGRRRGGRLFTVHHLPSAGECARLGIAIGRKVSPRATRRNYIKRVVRECFRRHAASLPAFDVVFIMRQPAAEVPADVLFTAVCEALSQLEAGPRSGAAA